MWLNMLQNNHNSNAYSDTSPNSWNSSTMMSYMYNGAKYFNYTGNYWGDYSDASVDGIGLTPYNINASNDVDYYPMANSSSTIVAPTATPIPTNTPTPSVSTLIALSIIGIVGYCIGNKK
jgi:nitrous oxidase accessory protein NosD